MTGPEGKDPIEARIRRMTAGEIAGAEGLSDEEAKVLILRYGAESSPETPLSFRGEDAANNGNFEIGETVEAIERKCVRMLEQSGAIVVEDGGIRKARPEEMN